jgi:hypothetical protein
MKSPVITYQEIHRKVFRSEFLSISLLRSHTHRFQVDHSQIACETSSVSPLLGHILPLSLGITLHAQYQYHSCSCPVAIPLGPQFLHALL